MHRPIIKSHNLVTEIKKTLTRRRIGTKIAFHRDMMSKMTICLSIPLMTQEPSPSLCLKLISISYFAGEAICRGKYLQVPQVSHSAYMINQALQQVHDQLYMCPTVVSHNSTEYDYLLVKKSLALIAIFREQYQDTPLALEMLWVQVKLHHHRFVV